MLVRASKQWYRTRTAYRLSTQTSFTYKNDVIAFSRRKYSSMSMGAKIKHKRMKMGLSLQQVADEVGASKAHIYELELNKVKNPSVETLKKLAKLFGMPLAFLLEEDEDLEFQVMFRDLQKDLADLDPKDQEAVTLMVQALKARKERDSN